MKFLAVRRVSLMTHHECHVDCPFHNHVTKCWVRTEPPPTVKAMGRPFKPSFLALNPMYPETLSHGLVIGLTGSHSSSLSSSSTSPICKHRPELE